ncbi:MAG: hypothetical protein ACPL3E_01070 [Minisyncoccia bacterium]
MANQQLVDYLKEQLESGAKREDLKQALLNIGWQMSDIEEALKVIDNESGALKNSESNLVNLKEISQNKDLVKDSKPQSSEEYLSKADFLPTLEKVSEIKLEEKKSEENKNILQKPVATSNASVQPQQIQIESLPPHHKKIKIIIYVLFGLVIAGLLGLVLFLYQKNNNLENQINALVSQRGDVENQSQSLTKTINELQQQNSSLKANNDLLNSEKSNLMSHLLLFSQSTSSLEVELVGKILFEKNQYVLKTNQDILVTIKNSKDEKVKTVLNSFVDKEVKVRGLRTPGLREITITDINNQSIDSLFNSQNIPSGPELIPDSLRNPLNLPNSTSSNNLIQQNTTTQTTTTQ